MRKIYVRTENDADVERVATFINPNVEGRKKPNNRDAYPNMGIKVREGCLYFIDGNCTHKKEMDRFDWENYSVDEFFKYFVNVPYKGLFTKEQIELDRNASWGSIAPVAYGVKTGRFDSKIKKNKETEMVYLVTAVKKATVREQEDGKGDTLVGELKAVAATSEAGAIAQYTRDELSLVTDLTGVDVIVKNF